MSQHTFKNILQSAISWMKQDAATNPAKYNSCGGESFEPLVKDALQYALNDLGVIAEIKYHSGSHAFPDIILECDGGIKYGVEVKSTKSNQWKINGNSVLGTTSERDISEIYIFFGKLVKDAPEFRVRKYEECISDIAVTHSPRYKIDMNQPAGETFFDKSGISYDSMKYSDDPITLVKEYYKSIGATAWWLSESSPPIIRLLCELPTVEKNKLLGYGFAYFPEVLSSNLHKYRRYALWLITKHSVIATNLRDYFSSSGQVNLNVNGKTYKKSPKIYKRLQELKEMVVSIIDDTSVDILAEMWHYNSLISNDISSKMRVWLSIVQSQNLQNKKEKPIDANGLVDTIFCEY